MHKRQALKQVHVLLVFEQRAVQGRNRLGLIALAQNFIGDIVGHQQLQPIDQFGGRGLFLQTGDGAQIEKHFHRLLDQIFRNIRVVHIDDLTHGVAIGEIDKVKETAAQKSVGQFFFVVRGDDNDGALPGLDRLSGFVDEELHAIEFNEQIVGELDIRLVDLVDKQHDLLIGGKRLPQLALLDVVAHIVDALVAQLRIAQAGHGVVLIEALLSLGGGLDMPLDQGHAEAGGHLFGEHGLARAGLALDQQGALQSHGGVDRHAQVVGGDIALGTFKLHK